MEELDCQDVVEIITEYLENNLPPDKRASLDGHLRDCDGCDVYLAQMNLVRQQLGSVQFDALDAVARDALIATFREWKKSA